jgi:hypothetical protein
MSARVASEGASFVVARNPQADSKLPYLLRLPLEGGLVLKAREPWPATARVYCHRFEEPWPQDAEIIEQTPVLLCRRRGAAIDLVLDRTRRARSQVVFTQVKGREAIFWQTQKTARAANPGGRIPRRRTLTDAVTIAVPSFPSPPSSSSADTRLSTSWSTSTAAGLPTSSPGSRCATPKSTSSSPTPAASPKSGPTASSPPRSPTAPSQTRAAAETTFTSSGAHSRTQSQRIGIFDPYRDLRLDANGENLLSPVIAT